MCAPPLGGQPGAVVLRHLGGHLPLRVLAPVLGSLADHKGHKKRLFVACLVLGVAFTLFSALTDDYRGLLVGYVISHIGFSGSCLFTTPF